MASESASVVVTDAAAAEQPRAGGAKPVIAKVGVIGSGVMGSGIAAHAANAGAQVVLLDIVPEGATDRSMLAKGALEKMAKQKPAPFMSSRAAKLITVGNLEDDLQKLADCDWIVEVVVERLDVKQQIYRALDTVRKPGSIVSSNTSTIPLQKLVDGLPESFRRDFLVTHFFNPPRYMRLLEIVAGPATRPEVVEAIRAFCDVRLGKSVVFCKDTPAFIANRIGTFWIEVATREAIDLGLTVEEADAVAGKYIGFPKTGIFGLADLVGIDLMPHIAASLLSTLPEGDAYRSVHREEPLITRMIESGLTGPQGQGRLLPHGEEGRRARDAGDRPADRRVPPDARGAARESRRGEERRQRAGGAARARRALRPRRAVRVADAVADARLRGVARAGDRRRRRQRRRGDARRLQLGVRAVRAHRPAGAGVVRAAAGGGRARGAAAARVGRRRNVLPRRRRQAAAGRGDGRGRRQRLRRRAAARGRAAPRRRQARRQAGGEELARRACGTSATACSASSSTPR